MSTIKYYLDELKNQKDRLVSTLNQQGIPSEEKESLERIVDKTIIKVQSSGTKEEEELDSQIPCLILDEDVTYFETKAASVTIAATGRGKVFVTVEDAAYDLDLSDKDNTLTITNESGLTKRFVISCADVDTLDLHGNEIETLHLGTLDKIKKLVVYNNLISSFVCPTGSTLRFLHIFNNPICDDDAYATNLEALFESLPDRAQESIGSIITYPWYGLEKLICFDDNANYVKYPKTYEQPEFVFEENVLYGLVQTDELGKEFITYCKFDTTQGKHFQDDETIKINRHHDLRKHFEQTSALKKNWMFGSAILYDAIASKDFQYWQKETGVADVWETAEKGFGMCFCNSDEHTGWVPGWKDMNIETFGGSSSEQDATDYVETRQPFTIEEYQHRQNGNSAKQFTHGDMMLSILVGRGEGYPYGACPNAKFLPIMRLNFNNSDNLTKEANLLKALSPRYNAISYSVGVGHTQTETENPDEINNYQLFRRLLNESSKNKICIAGAGNGGYEQEWMGDNNAQSLMFGDSDTNESNTIICGSLTPFSTPSLFSEKSVSICDDLAKGFTTEKDYVSGYGVLLAGRSQLQDGERISKLASAQGTSCSAPTCSGLFGLMRIIYSKLYPDCQDFGKNSKFVEYVKKNWMDTLEDHMMFAVGMGTPNFLVEKKPTLAQLQEEPLLAGRVRGSVGEELAFKSKNPNRGAKKSGYCFDFNANYFARTDENTYVPLRQLNDTNVGILKGYTLTSAPAKEGEREGSVEAYNKVQIEVLLNDSEQDYSIEPQGKINFSTKNFEDATYVDFVTPTELDAVDDLEVFTIQLTVDFKKILENAVYNSSNSYGITDIIVTPPQDGGKGVYIQLRGMRKNSEDKFTTKLTESSSPTSATNYTRFFYGGSTSVSYQTWGLGTPSLHLTDDAVAILTFMCDQEKVELFYNGTKVLEALRWLTQISLDTLGYDADCLKEKASTSKFDNVIIYNRKLTQKEIIHNAIALLQDLEV